MPHLTLEFTAPLPVALDLQSVLAGLHRVLGDLGYFRLAELKSRAVPLECTRIGDGARPGVFVHLTVAILSGRDPLSRQRISEVCLTELLTQFDAITRRFPCDVTVEVREMERESYGKAMNALAR